MPIDRIFAELHNPATWPPAPRPSMQPAYWRGLGRTPEQTRRRWPASRVNRGSRARPAANALHEKHSRRVRRDVEALVAGLAENRCAVCGRNHGHRNPRHCSALSAITMRILRDIFGHSGNIT